MLKRNVAGLLVLIVFVNLLHAGAIKNHGWQQPVGKVESNRLDVEMDVGYYVHVVDQKPVKVIQDTSSSDPYHTYIGCKTTDIISNFNVELMVEASETSLAGGQWVATINPFSLVSGTNTVSICVKGSDVRIENLVGSGKGIRVAEVVVMVLPQ